MVERGTHEELYALRGRYFDLHTKAACSGDQVDQARSRNRTNRVGFTVTLAKEVAEQKGETTSEVYQTLLQLERERRRSRLAEPDTFSSAPSN